MNEFAEFDPSKDVEISSFGPLETSVLTLTASLLSDTQLAISNEDVLTVLVRLTVFGDGDVLSWIVSVSSILILLTISPYNLLSNNALPCACVPPPGGASNVIVGCVV